MRLDVLIPTLNRAPLLRRALDSLLAASVPDGLDVAITVVDNGCTDATADVVAELIAAHPGRLRLVREPRRGKSRALNTGVAATDGDLVGMIDDDEEVQPDWYREIHRAFRDESLDFIGGPYIAAWSGTPPAWIPREYLAVVGDVNSGSGACDYSPDFAGILKGGNAVIRRRTLRAVGPYTEYLGPTRLSRLLSCEDEDMYYRLLAHGARGRYLPSLVIYHNVLVERLSPGYYRRWCFWRGVSRGLMDRMHPLPVPYLAGIPRFIVGRAARGALRWLRARVRLEPWERSLADELPVWDLAGYACGRCFSSLARRAQARRRQQRCRLEAPNA